MQGKQQQCIHLLYELLVRQCEYTTQPKGSFWCHVIDAKGAFSIPLIFTNKFVLVLHLSFSFRYLVSGRVKAAAEPQEWSNLGLDMDNFITWQDS